MYFYACIYLYGNYENIILLYYYQEIKHVPLLFVKFNNLQL